MVHAKDGVINDACKFAALREIERKKRLRQFVRRHRVKQIERVAAFHRAFHGRRVEQVADRDIDAARHGCLRITDEKPHVYTPVQ